MKPSVDGILRAILDKSICKIPGTKTCAVLKLLSKKRKRQLEMNKEGILFFCYIVILQKYSNIFSVKTQHLFLLPSSK